MATPKNTKSAPPEPAVTAPNRMGPARYAWLSMDTSLSIGSTGSREEGARKIFLEGNDEVAAMELVGDRLIVDFLPPKDASAFAHLMQHYTQTPGRPGWLRFDRPATRDPRPALEADLGNFLGAASFQRK